MCWHVCKLKSSAISISLYSTFMYLHLFIRAAINIGKIAIIFKFVFLGVFKVSLYDAHKTKFVDLLPYIAHRRLITKCK